MLHTLCSLYSESYIGPCCGCVFPSDIFVFHHSLPVKGGRGIGNTLIAGEMSFRLLVYFDCRLFLSVGLSLSVV